MPITWSIESGGRFVRMSIADPYTIDEWRDTVTTILESPAVHSPLRLLVDRRDTQSLTKAMVEGINRFFAEHQQGLAGVRAAVLLSRGVYFEMARMLRTVVRIPNTSVRTFRDYDEAVEWLTR
jgi:hypothetical protein